MPRPRRVPAARLRAPGAVPRAAAVAAAAALLTAACGASPGPGPATATGSPAPLQVVAAVYPLQFVAEQVGGARVQVTALAAAGAEPHDLELTPAQVAEIGEADLVLYVPGLQPAVDDAVADLPADRVLDVTDGLPLIPLDGGGAGQDASGADGGADDGQEAFDPHVWLDPTLVADIGTALADRLDGTDAADRQTFITGRERLRAMMNALDQRWAGGTRTCRTRTLVVSHAAFGYLARRYDLEQLGISGATPDAQVSPNRVAEVVSYVRANPVTTVYTGPAGDAAARTVASETGTATAVLDPLETRPAAADADYVSVMDANLAAVRAGQGCT